jgi:hypothetical protein
MASTLRGSALQALEAPERHAVSLRAKEQRPAKISARMIAIGGGMSSPAADYSVNAN